jgi:HAD superfamily hydrolase (TIGR01509 family)
LGPFDAVVAAAETGVEKPGTRSFERALEALGVTAGRALHVGDQASDEEGARAAGMHYLPAPLAAAVKGLA